MDETELKMRIEALEKTVAMLLAAHTAQESAWGDDDSIYADMAREAREAH